MDAETLKLFKAFRAHSPSMLVGREAEMALRNARTLKRFRELEARDLVRMRAEPEQESYFDVFGEPDTKKERDSIIDIIDRLGCWRTVSEYRGLDGEWEHADSCGMHTGYRDVLDPFENCYVIDEMAEAVCQTETILAEPRRAFDAACRDIETV